MFWVLIYQNKRTFELFALCRMNMGACRQLDDNGQWLKDTVHLPVSYLYEVRAALVLAGPPSHAGHHTPVLAKYWNTSYTWVYFIPLWAGI